MGKEYDIIEVIRLRDEEKLKWKEIEEIIGVSLETLRKTYKRTKEGKTFSQINPNHYKQQRLRGLKRKYEAILSRGGKCEKCGYDHNIAALDFHHINPEEKEFEIDLRKFSNLSLEKLQKELDKCILVCANCHRELHNPDLTMTSVTEQIKEAEDKKSFSNQDEYGRICPVCGKRFPSSTGKIYCSDECRDSVRYAGYPTIEEVEEQYNELGTWDKVAESFGLTRKVIQGIRKRAGKL